MRSARRQGLLDLIKGERRTQAPHAGFDGGEFFLNGVRVLLQPSECRRRVEVALAGALGDDDGHGLPDRHTARFGVQDFRINDRLMVGAGSAPLRERDVDGEGLRGSTRA